jgi:hypothetical protein
MSNTNFDSSNLTQRRTAQAIASYNRDNACGRKGECYSYSQEVITLKQVATTIPDCCISTPSHTELEQKFKIIY